MLVSKQTSIESGYNIFDEIIWKTGSQCLGTGMTAVLRHTAIHSYVIPRFIPTSYRDSFAVSLNIDPANKQRDDTSLGLF
ncbi:hypothetical protein [Wolbachia endosymbiont (group A) of Rhinocyllus conicus]|uniref:hypothetical protein n=1 Tax=Wolbachia endosymbiont (group A) of Rhinocyllus conicus TaxID=2954053 RepID=UPI002227974E|nr:hypothetical protein [Wolbachia endosymbiont (group A) of Rhinocyllus conicus]